MNWRKGLLRLWCALSLCWIILIGAIVWNIEQNYAKRMKAHISCVKEEQEKLRGKTPDPWDSLFNICVEQSGMTHEDLRLHFARVTVMDTIKSYVNEYGALTLLPPLVTLILGLLSAWVASGFKGAKTRLQIR
jgi:hypothetical protein